MYASRHWLAALGVAWAAGLAGAGPAEPDPKTISIDAQYVEYQKSGAYFRHAKIQQADMSVEADTATADDLSGDNSRWDFRGNVHITMTGSTLDSDSAVVEVRKGILTTAVIVGTPARFEQKRDKGTARGHAGRIDYDVDAQSIRLSDQAWLSYNDGEITGRTLVYSMRDQRVLANPQDQADQRVHITIKPKATPTPPAGTPSGTPP
jgi:lipopolysaccharide transport protein LptA